METLHGKNVVVLGATGRIGRGWVEAFLALGAHVIAAARRRTSLDQLRSALRDHSRLRVAEVDVTDAVGVGQFAAHATATAPLAAVFSAAGAYTPATWETVSEATLAALVRTNMVGAVHILKAFLPPMRAQGRGLVAFLDLGDDLRAPDTLAYRLSKAPLTPLLHEAEASVGAHGVRIHALLPSGSPDPRDPLPAAWCGAANRLATWLVAHDGAERRPLSLSPKDDGPWHC